MKNVYLCTGHELKIPNVVDSRGVYLFDEKGKRYMDLESGVWCVSVGHKNERVCRAISNQLDSLMHAGFCYGNQIVDESAKSVLDITGLIGGKCLFLCSGSEGIEVSRQIAKHLTGRRMSMTLHDSYLGSYGSVTDRTRDWFILDWESCKTCAKSEQCDPMCEALQDIPEDIADFLFEPGSSSGFVRFPPKALIQNIVTIVRNNGGKIIVNEVTTGVGRTGKWWGFQHYDMEPDMVAIGKGIGNGYPVSVAAISRGTVDELYAKPFKYAQSHQNDPMGAAVVQAVMQEIEENGLIAEAEQKGGRFLSQLQSLVDHKIILDVRGRGMIFALDLPSKELAEEIYSGLIEQGYIIGNRGATFRIDPPLTLTEEEFDGFFSIFKTLIESRKFNER